MADENTNNGVTSGSDTNDSQAGQAQNGGQEDQGTQNQPQYMTVEQYNKAMSSWGKRLQDSTVKAVETQLQGLTEALAKLQGNAQDNGATASQNQSGTSGNAGATSDPAVLKLQKQLEDMQKLLDNEKQEKSQAQVKARDERTKSQVVSLLNEIGVQKVEQVYRLVKDNLIVDENTGEVKIKTVDPQIHIEVENSLKTGLTDWLNSEGSHFLPARVQGGSGAAGGGKTVSNGKVVDLDALKAMKPSELAKQDLSQIIGADALKSFFNT